MNVNPSHRENIEKLGTSHAATVCLVNSPRTATHLIISKFSSSFGNGGCAYFLAFKAGQRLWSVSIYLPALGEAKSATVYHPEISKPR